MISNIFKKPNTDNLLEELKSNDFKESKANSMLNYVNINYKNQSLENFLHLIIIENKIESVKWLIDNGIDINAKNFLGMTPLMLACKFGYQDAVDTLIKAGADTSIETHKGYIAIEFAVFNGYYQIYKKLKPLLKDINRENKKGKTLLHIAVKVTNFKIIDDLFKDKQFKRCEDILFYKYSFANIDILNKIIDKVTEINKKDDLDRNILFYVVENGIKSEQIFQELVESGLDINTIDTDDNNILFHLIEKIISNEKKLESLSGEEKDEVKIYIKELMGMIPLILEYGIETKQINKDNETILSLSAKNKSIEILKILLDNDVNINLLNENKQTVLNIIAPKGIEFLEVIHILLDYGANPNIKDDKNKTVIENLIDAILIVREDKKAKNLEKRHLDFQSDYISILVSVLLNTDTNLSLLNSNGEPYFFEALRHGGVDIVKLLIKHGSDINETDCESNNVIYKYMNENISFKKENEQKEYHNNLQAIIMMGANVNAKDSYGGITLHKAILDCDTTLIKMLLHSGADMDAIDNRGRSILHNAVWKNDIKVFRLILSYNKALLNKPDKFGVLPINYAAFLGYTDLVLEFIERSGQINNPYRKTKYIINFLKKFHKNLKTLIENARTKSQKDKILKLVENMKEEFEVKN